MSTPSHFSRGGRASRVSAAGIGADAYAGTGYGQQRGLGSILPTGVAPATPAPTLTDPLEQLRQQVRAFAPTAKLRLYILLEEDGFDPQTRRYCIELSGPDVRGASTTKAATAEQALAGAKRSWAIARRVCDIERLVEECQRIAGCELSGDYLAMLRYEMQAVDYSSFQIKAASFRASAVAYAKQQAA